jgi:hypothetical protein
MTVTAISAVVARRPAMFGGWVTGVQAQVRPWVRLEIEFCDGTGTITLRFLGRTQIPGIVIGRQMAVEGTPWLERDTLVVVNPLYLFLDGQAPSACKFPDGRSDEVQG